MHRRLVVAAIAAAALLTMAAGSAGAARLSNSAGAVAAKRVPPAGYFPLDTNQITAPNGQKTRGVAQCPTGTVPFGGGVVVSSPSTLANVAASFPRKTSWVGDVTNASGVDTTFQIEVICATKPAGYRIVKSAQVVNPSGLQTSATVTCPGGTMPLGGGGNTSALALSVNMNSTGPQGRSWFVTENNASPFSEALTAFAVCGKVHGYRTAVGAAFANGANAQSSGAGGCPAPDEVVGGGVFSASPELGVNLGGTVNGPHFVQWFGFVNNATAFASTASAVVVCATR